MCKDKANLKAPNVPFVSLSLSFVVMVLAPDCQYQNPVWSMEPYDKYQVSLDHLSSSLRLIRLLRTTCYRPVCVHAENTNLPFKVTDQ